jgi:hypothetical protein
MKTLVLLRHLQIDDRQLYHGEELPPDLLPPEAIDLHFDKKEIAEYDSAERRSLYRFFHHFTGASEKERLSAEEYAAYAL